MRYLLTLTAAAVLASAAQAQFDETVIRLTIDPAPAPVPALRYQLLPELRDKTSGNAATLYYRAMAPEWGIQKVQRDENLQNLMQDWNPRRLPPRAFRWVLNDKSLQVIDRGARQTYKDWKIISRLRKLGITLQTPEIYASRTAGRLLSIRARLQIEKSNYCEAMYTFQTGFALCRDLAKAPTLFHGLSASALCSLLLEQLEAMIGSRRSPNLYWALCHTPKPFVDMNNGFQGEQLSMDALLPGVRDALRSGKPMPNDQALAVARNFADGAWTVAAVESAPPPDFLSRAQIAHAAAKGFSNGKKALLQRGWAKKVVAELPVTVVWLFYEMHNYERFHDKALRWRGLPYYKAQERMKQEEKQYMDETGGDAIRYGMQLVRALNPNIRSVLTAEIRPDRKIAALRCVEAIRMYLANHDKLPAKLADIKEVPIPLDPATGKAFIYERKGDKCELRTHPNPYEPEPYNVLHYELTVRQMD